MKNHLYYLCPICFKQMIVHSLFYSKNNCVLKEISDFKMKVCESCGEMEVLELKYEGKFIKKIAIKFIINLYKCQFPQIFLLTNAKASQKILSK